MKLIAIAIVALLAACGGGGSSETPQAAAVAPVQAVTAPTPALSVVSTLFTQVGVPTLVNDPGDESWYPKDSGMVVTFDLGQAPISWDDRGLGFVMTSWEAPENSNMVKTMNYTWMPTVQPAPWAVAGSQDVEICQSYTLDVPESLMQRSLANYVGSDIWLVDGSEGGPTSGKVIILSSMSFVHNAGSNEEGPFQYANLNAVQFRGAIAPGSQYISTLEGTMRTGTGYGPERFTYCLSMAQAQHLMDLSVDLLGGRMDARNARVKQILIGSEANLGVTSSKDPEAVGSFLVTYMKDWTLTLRR